MSKDDKKVVNRDTAVMFALAYLAVGIWAGWTYGKPAGAKEAREQAATYDLMRRVAQLEHEKAMSEAKERL